MQFGSLGMFNFQEKTNRFYIATFQQEQSMLILHTILHTSPPSPTHLPSLTYTPLPLTYTPLLPHLSSSLYPARLHSLLSVGVDYPATPPRFAIMMESNAGQRDPFDIQTKVSAT